MSIMQNIGPCFKSIWGDLKYLGVQFKKDKYLIKKLGENKTIEFGTSPAKF